MEEGLRTEAISSKTIHTLHKEGNNFNSSPGQIIIIQQGV